MEKIIETGSDAKICIRWNILPMDYSREKEDSIRALTAKKYNIPLSNVKIEVNFINERHDSNSSGLNFDNISNIQDPKFQQELFKQYLSENGIEDYDFEELVKIDSKINALINYNSYEKGQRYSIKWVRWSNFLSYGDDNYFDFTTLNGLVLLNGNPANESGKSTFAYDLLHFLLFGKTNTDKAKTNDQLFNNYRKDCNEVNVEGCIRINGFDYIINRKLTRSKTGKVSQKVEYYSINENGYKEELKDKDETNLQGESTTKTTKIIKEALGNENDFDLIISANAKDLDTLISLKETDRGRLLSRWIGLSPIEDKDIKAREMWNKQISTSRYCTVYNRVNLATEIENLNNDSVERENLIKKEKERVETSTKNISELNTELNTLISAKKPINDDLFKVDVHTIETRLEQIKEYGKNKSEEIRLLNEKVNSYGTLEYNEENYKQNVLDKEQCITDIASIKVNIANFKNEIENLQKSEYCPTCGRKMDNVDNSKLIEERNNKIKELINLGVEIKKKLDGLTDIIKQTDEIRTNIFNKNKDELKLSALTIEINNLRTSFNENKRLLDELNANKEAIVENNNIDISINLVKSKIDTENNILIQANNNIVTYNLNIEANKRTINEKQAIINKIIEEEKEEKNWKLYLQMIGKDGICKIVLRNSLPIINGELKRLLTDVADFDVEITINDKNDVDFWLIRDNIKTRLSAASGLERTQAALALRVVLGKMSNLSRPPFILLDEVLGTVSSENYDKMKKLYDTISVEYDFILHITHLDTISDWHNKVITVTKVNNISSIKNN